MQRSLFLLILIGQCAFIACQLYEYHFIKDSKTWEEAQKHCREKYTDLATVYDMTDMRRLCKCAEEEAWIGLYNDTESNRTWHWSLPGVGYNESNSKWNEKEPNDKDGLENCVIMETSNHKWKDLSCNSTNKFICYNEKKKEPNKRFHLIDQEMNWLQAQNYCRENHTDLVSGLDQLEDEEFKNEANSRGSLWIGLFRDTWKWSDGNSSSFRNWENVKRFNEKSSGQGNEECVVVKRKNGKWGTKKCDKKKPFICYNDKMILINESKTWVEALYYCRENYDDLVSITSLDEQRWVQEKVKKANSPYVWLGLRYTCTLGFWFWVSDKVVEYQNWDSDFPTDDCDMSGAMKKGGEHKWIKKLDNETFNFICSKF